jgi:hypothetical protein
VQQTSRGAQEVTAILERKVEQMIKGAEQRAGSADRSSLLPLIRLRVDYTGFSTINAQRFGQKFVGRVANPHDMLLFHKAAARKPKVWMLWSWHPPQWQPCTVQSPIVETAGALLCCTCETFASRVGTWLSVFTCGRAWIGNVGKLHWS